VAAPLVGLNGRFKLPQQEMWKTTYKPLTQARRSRPEAVVLPRAPVEITFALTSRDSTGSYEWRLLTPNRQTLLEGFSDAEAREEFRCVVVRAGLSGHPPGDYLLAFRPENASWVYSLVSLPAGYPVKLWKRS